MTPTTATTGHTLVTTGEVLNECVVAARREGSIGLDTEFVRERTYRPRLCLVQVAAGDAVFVIDALAGLDLTELMSVIESPDVTVLVHAGRQDLELFYERSGTVPKEVFDVQVAAGFAGHGASLSYGRLIESVLGVSLTKGESYTDWCRRPLTTDQLRYAADDVRYLAPAAERLRHDLEQRQRLDWMLDEMQALEREQTYVVEPSETWRRVGGRGTLSGRQTAVLREVAAWREETAASRDIPRGWVIKDPTLIEIARRTPSSIGALKQIRGLNAKEAERSGASLLGAIERGLKSPAIEKGRPPSRSIQARARMLSGLADAIVRARCEAAGIAMELVTTRGETETLLTEFFSGTLDEPSHRVLQGWRRVLAGDAILGLARGRIGVKAVDRPPYVEEVILEDQSGG